MGKEALVVKKDILFKEKQFLGFISSKEYDFVPIITNNYSYEERGEKLENDQTLQQIIPYILIVNPKTKKVFTYKRAPDERYTESRLRNKWSLGLGGHIERIDDANPLIEGMMRELKEEVKMKSYPQPKIIGFIKLDSSSVDRVHFGVAFLVETQFPVEPGDDEMAECNFYSINEFEDLIANKDNDLEGWSRAVWPYIKEYLSK